MGRDGQSRRSGAAFAQLEPRLHYVTAAAVKKKWKKLSTSSQDNIRDILLSAKTQSKGEKLGTKKAAQDIDHAIEEVTARLSDRLPRMPFPPAANEETFDYELTLHRIQNIEQQITDTVHSMSLLRTQIKKEELLLDADKEEIEHLNASLKSNDALRRQQRKTLHPIADHHTTSFTVNTTKSATADYTTDMSKLLHDPAIDGLLQQLRDHLDSISNNTSGMQSVVKCMDKTHEWLNLLAVHQSDAQRPT